MAVVVVDTSFLVQLAHPGLQPVLEELERRIGKLELVVPSPVLGELRRVASRKRIAGVALEYASRLRVFYVGLPPDDSVLEAAEKLGGYVATMDKEILREARRRGIPYITLRDNFPVIVGAAPE